MRSISRRLPLTPSGFITGAVGLVAGWAGTPTRWHGRSGAGDGLSWRERFAGMSTLSASGVFLDRKLHDRDRARR